jgi:hypothetical protein
LVSAPFARWAACLFQGASLLLLLLLLPHFDQVFKDVLCEPSPPACTEYISPLLLLLLLPLLLQFDQIFYSLVETNKLLIRPATKCQA